MKIHDSIESINSTVLLGGVAFKIRFILEFIKMKEKIGIEKLIELLNEYENTDTWENGYQVEFRESRIISKKFGFVKWLVENDKIKPLRKFIGWETDEDEPYIQFDLVDQYIAYLSIQDEPIRFLCEILK